MSGTSCSYLLSASQEKWSIPRTSTSNTAGDRPRNDTSIWEVHAEGHFRRRLSTLKMLLSGHLHRGKLILTDRKTASAKFFPFWGREDFVGLRKILPGTPGLTTSRDSRPWLSSRAKLGSLLRGTSFTKNRTFSEGYAPHPQ